MWSQVLTATALPSFNRPEIGGSALDRSSLIVESEPEPRAFAHRRWPVHSTSAAGEVDLTDWSLRVFGAVTDELRFTWQDMSCLPEADAFADADLTSRRRAGRHWLGVDVSSVLALAGARGDADWLVVHSEGGYRRDLPLDRVFEGPALLARQVDDGPLSNRDGGPLRLILPRLDARNYAKWVRGLELRTDLPG